MTKKRLLSCLISGAILGIFCIIGATIRFGGEKEFAYVFALWYNRVLMGLMIGFLPNPQKLMTAVLRGALLGTVVSFAFFASAGFGDVVSFFAGTIYGVIIELIAFRYNK